MTALKNHGPKYLACWLLSAFVTWTDLNHGGRATGPTADAAPRVGQ